MIESKDIRELVWRDGYGNPIELCVRVSRLRVELQELKKIMLFCDTLDEMIKEIDERFGLLLKDGEKR